MACGPGSPELSKSYMDMASKLFTFTFTFPITLTPAAGSLCVTFIAPLPRGTASPEYLIRIAPHITALRCVCERHPFPKACPRGCAGNLWRCAGVP